VRWFLAKEYGVVMAMLERHRLFVAAIAERLLADPILDQATLMELAGVHVAKSNAIAYEGVAYNECQTLSGY